MMLNSWVDESIIVRKLMGMIWNHKYKHDIEEIIMKPSLAIRNNTMKEAINKFMVNNNNLW